MAESPSTSSDGLKIINVGLFRMGTKSMAHAYQILGFRTHHGLLEDVFDTPWTRIEEAAEATWPSVPGGQARRPFERADWDELWGSEYEAVTDLASPFALNLIKAYPEAKVVVVQREFDSWWNSFQQQILDSVMMPPPMDAIGSFIFSYILKNRAPHAMKKVVLGLFGARTKEECAANARRVYDAYYQEVRELVPAERRLEYRLGDGWEPLCRFLGVDVPKVDFPRVNDRHAHQAVTKSRLRQVYSGVLKFFLPWLIGMVAVVMAWSYYGPYGLASGLVSPI